jgi:ADP-heptose:LPS heptosyltransferase
VIHPGALGDVLLAVPALRALRHEGLAVTLAAQPRIGTLLAELGVVDRALVFDTLGLDALFADAPLAPEAPVARALATAARVVCWFGARDAGFARRLGDLAPAAVIAPPASTTLPVWRHLRETVAGTGGEAADTVPIVVSPAQRERGRQALRAAGWDGAAPVVIVHPGAGGAAKRWPVDGFLDVIAGIDAAIVVHEGPADTDAARALLGRARGRVLALVEPPLAVLAGVLAEATAYVGNDSGISHLAAAVGTPSVVLFTPPALPWLPWSPTARCLTVSTACVVPVERDAVRAALASLA